MSEITKETQEVTFVKKTCEECGREIKGRTEKQLNYLMDAHKIKHNNK